MGRDEVGLTDAEYQAAIRIHYHAEGLSLAQMVPFDVTAWWLSELLQFDPRYNMQRVFSVVTDRSNADWLRRGYHENVDADKEAHTGEVRQSEQQREALPSPCGELP